MATNKIYKVYNTEESSKAIIHEYTISVTINDNGHEEITLFRSFDDCWEESHRGQELIKLIDTGDMVVYPKKMYSGDVDYAQHAELFILLSFLNRTEHMPLYQGSIEEITPGKSFDI
jgi:hypothetical protein